MNGSPTGELLTVIKNLAGWRGVETQNELLETIKGPNAEEMQTRERS